MRKIKKRLLKRYNQLKKHPITKGKELIGILRYIDFNLRCRIFSSVTYNWIGGLKFIARKGDAGIVGNIYFGLYEFEESLFLLHFLNHEDYFLDIGANVGHYALLASGINKCKTLAIEPVPDTFSQLELNIELNGLSHLIETKNIGLSSDEGVLLISTDKGTMDQIVDKNYLNSVSVRVSTIDQIVKIKTPFAIKIDVEGYEKFVLEGAKLTLKSKILKVLIIELNKSGEIYNVKDKEIFNLIKSYGFKPYAYNPKTRTLIPLTNYNTHKFNTIFVRDVAFVANRLKEGHKIKIKEKQF